jgi:AraC family transcriptional regulator
MSRKLIQDKICIRELGELKLVGFRVLCDGNQYIKEIPKASQKLQHRLHDIKHVKNSQKQVGAFVVDASSEQNDGYWVCVEVDRFEDIPSDMNTLIVPPQKYAFILHEGSNSEIRSSYELLHQWTIENNHERLLKKWHIEIFHDFENKDQLRIELFDTII